MKPEANIKQKTKAEPLFGSIEPEWIELEDVEGKPQKLLRPTPKEILLLLAVFLSVFIDNGEVALDRKSTRLRSSHRIRSRMPSSA